MEPRDCKRTKDLFSDCFDGELETKESSFFHGHLEACPLCRHAWTSYETTFRTVRDLPLVEASGAFETRLRSRIRREEAAPAKSTWWGDLARIPLPVPLGAAALLITTILAYNQFSTGPAANPADTDAFRAAAEAGDGGSRVDNTRPSFLPDFRPPSIGNVVDFSYGPPRPNLVMEGNNGASLHPRDRAGVPLEGPYPQTYNDGYGTRLTTGDRQGSRPVDTLQTR